MSVRQWQESQELLRVRNKVLRQPLMTPEQFITKLAKQQQALERCVHRELPIKVGREAKNHFQENFQKGGFVDGGLHKWKPAKRIGKGEMLKQESLAPAVKHSADPHEGIPLIPIEVVAGWNGVDTQGVSVIDCEQYHIPDFMAAGAEYLIRVSGSSMYPKYSSGDILACKKIHEITFFQWGKIYVIDSAQGAMVKRLFECTTNTDNIICKSDNEKYPPFELPKSEIVHYL